jgi:hypothetical protein
MNPYSYCLQFLSRDVHGVDAALVSYLLLGESKYSSGYTTGNQVKYVLDELKGLGGPPELANFLAEKLVTQLRK